MGKLVKIFLSLCFCIYISSVFALAAGSDSTRYEILLNSQLFKDINLNQGLTSSIDFTSRNLILISSTNCFFQLGWGGLAPYGNKGQATINSFAFTPDSLLMVITDNELCYMDASGNLAQLYKLPDKGMGISRGRQAMYIYDKNNVKNKYSIYALGGKGKYAKLLEMPYPILSVAEFNNSIVFSNQNAIFQYNPKEKKLTAIASFPSGTHVKSIAVDTTENRIFFSSEQMVCTIKDNKLAVLTDKTGGFLSYFYGLIIYNPEAKQMIRISSSDFTIPQKNDKSIKPEVTSFQETLTNKSIIELVIIGLSDNQIVERINHSKPNFNLSVDAMIELSNQQVSSEVIMAMKKAMKNRSTDTP